MNVSIVIPCLNEEKTVARCIRSVAGWAFEIIVVDGGSSDRTRKISQQEGAIVLDSDRGRGLQLCRGAEHTRGDLLLFLHADNWLDADVGRQLEKLTHQSDDSRKFLHGCFRQSIEDERRRFRWIERGNAWRARWCKLPYGDQAVFLSRWTYDQVGGFDRVPLMEDVMIARRLGKMGPPVLLPGPVYLDARRWHADGVIRRTLHNWLILMAFTCGVPPKRLARWYG